METSLYSVDFACAFNHLVWHEHSSHVPQVACVPGVADPPEYNILDGHTTNISCTDVTQT